MNKYITSTLAAITAVALLAGCASTPTPTATEQTAVTAAAALGTAYDLQQRPSDLAYFTAAEAELYSISASTNTVTTTDVNNALAESGNTNALESIGLTTAVNLANSLISQNTGTNAAAITIKDVCGWLADGISESVAAPLANIKEKSKAPHKK